MTPEADLSRQRKMVAAFLTASRNGDFDALLEVLDPNVRLRADAIAVRAAAESKWGGVPELPAEAHGAHAVAEALRGRARGVRAALLDGTPGAAFMMGGGQVGAAWAFTFAPEKILGIDLLMDPERLERLRVEVEGGERRGGDPGEGNRFDTQ